MVIGKTNNSGNRAEMRDWPAVHILIPGWSHWMFGCFTCLLRRHQSILLARRHHRYETRALCGRNLVFYFLYLSNLIMIVPLLSMDVVPHASVHL